MNLKIYNNMGCVLNHMGCANKISLSSAKILTCKNLPKMVIAR